jgi:hypothetical protein
VENEGNVLRWVARSLNKQVPSGEDIWALHVISARLAELPDPDPPSDPWGHTSVGQGADSDGDGIGPLTDDEITRLRSLLQKTKGR